MDHLQYAPQGLGTPSLHSQETHSLHSQGDICSSLVVSNCSQIMPAELLNFHINEGLMQDILKRAAPVLKYERLLFF